MMYLRACGIAALLAGLLAAAGNASATATISTTASAALSADSSGAAYTLLTGPVLDEGAGRDLGTGTLILNAPAGFAFDPTAGVTATVSRLAGSGTILRLSSSNATVTAATISITVASRDALLGGTRARITWAGIGVRPTAGTPLAAGKITRTGSASISGVNGSTSFGTLTEAPGLAAQLAFSTQPAGATAGAPFATQPVVVVQDQFGNNSTNGLTATDNVTLSLATGTGPLQGNLTANIGTAGGNGTAAFTGLRLDAAGGGRQLAATASAGLAGATSAIFAVKTAAASRLVIGTQPSAGAIVGVPFAQQPVVLVEDAFSNIRSNDTPLVTAAAQAGAGPLQGGTSVRAIGGVATYVNLAASVATNVILTFTSGSLQSAVSTPIVVSAAGGTGLVTNSFVFSYTNRGALLAGGWSFIGSTPVNPIGEVARNTEITNGAVVSYDQVAHPGVLRIPVDVGDLWEQTDDSRNTLFRALPTNWVSARLALFFWPTQNTQQANLAIYQDDDNYIAVGHAFNGFEKVAMDLEQAGHNTTLTSTPLTTTNLFLRLDRDLNTGTVTGFYSTDGTNWVTLSQTAQTLSNPQLAIFVGGSPSGFPNADLRKVDVVTSSPPPPAVLTSQPQHLVFNAVAGQPSTNLQRLHIVVRGQDPAVTWHLTNSASWLTASVAGGSTPGVCDVGVNPSGLAPGVYQANVQISAAGASPDTTAVTLVVNPAGRTRVATWRGAKAGAMSVSIDDSFTTAFDDLSTNGLTGSYLLWDLTPIPAAFTDYFNAGMEIGSHTVDHPCYGINEDQLRYEIEVNLANIAAAVPVSPADLVSFAWPCGVTSTAEEVVAADYFLSARGFNFNLLEDTTPNDFMNMKSFNSHSFAPEPPADLKTVVDAAIAQGKWFNLVLHATNADDGAIAYSLGKNLWNAPISSVVKYILQRDRTVLSNYVESSTSIQFDCYRLPLDPSTRRSFETAIHSQDALTFQVDLTGIPAVTGVTVGGAATPFTTQTIGGKTVLVFSAPVTTGPQRITVLEQPAGTNTPPILPLQVARTISELTLLVVTNTATDTNFPAQTLSYSLRTPPAGATIDAAGIIRWTPSEAQGPGTNTLTTVVTDNGVPPLSATNSFNVVVVEVNTAPVLPGQVNRTLVAQSALTVTNTATDADLPANVLSYQLTAAPTNAAISAGGVITWTPTAKQVPSTNIFTTVVTDSNPSAPTLQHLSATNSFMVFVLAQAPTNGLVLPFQPDRAANELTTLIVTNTATDFTGGTNGSGTNPSATNTFVFNYASRAALLAAGWNFLATQAGGAARNTEITNTANGAVISYDQTAHPNILRIPCDVGDLWGGINTSRNSLFRALPTNWVSMRLSLAFAPTLDTQQVHLALYQDDDNYVQAGLAYNSALGGEVTTIIYESNSDPVHALANLSGVTSMTVRLDRNPGSGIITGLYSVDGIAWNTLGTATPAFTNPRLGIWVGGSPVPWTNGLANCDLKRLDVILTNATAPALTYQLVNAPTGATIDGNGIITWTPSEAQGPGTNVITTIASKNSVPPLSATNSFTVTVNEINLPPALPAQLDQTLFGQTPLLVTNTATDADLPANPLSYQLATGPTNAAISVAGVITWTPTPAQVPSTNLFTTIVTDSSLSAVNSQHLTATNRFTVVVLSTAGNGPVLPAQVDRTIAALATLTVTNTATDPRMAVAPLATNTLLFNYTDRTALLAAGWSFNATQPGGAARNTEITSGAVASYDQAAHPGALRIPCDVGDLWGGANNTRNSIFRTLPTNWVSVQLSLAFAPTFNTEQAHLALYQDDDNYVQAGLAFNGSEKSAMDQEINGNPTTPAGVGVSASSIRLRLDRNQVNGNITAFYSLNGTTWVTLAQVSQALVNPRLGLWVGGSSVPYTNGAPVCDLQRLDIIVTNSPAPVLLTYRLISPPTGATISSNGIITWTPTASQAPSTNVFTTVVTDNGVPPLSATNSFVVIVTPSGPVALVEGVGELLVGAPVKMALSFLAGENKVLLSFAGTPGHSYEVQWASDLAGNWSALGMATADENGRVEYQAPASAPMAFFRVVDR